MQSSPGELTVSGDFPDLLNQGPPGVQSTFSPISKPGHYPHQDPEHQGAGQQEPNRGGGPHGAASHHIDAS